MANEYQQAYNQQPTPQQPNGMMKPCKHCRQMIDKRATVCPYCRKKQGSGCAVVIVVVIGLIVFSTVVGSMMDYAKRERGEQQPEQTDSSAQSTEVTTSPNYDLSSAVDVPSDILYDYGESYINTTVVTVAKVADKDGNTLKFSTDNNDSIFFSFICTFQDAEEIESLGRDSEVAFVGIVEGKDSTFNAVTIRDCHIVATDDSAISKKEEIESSREQQLAFAEQAKSEAEQAANEAAIADAEAYKASCATVDYEDVARNPDNYKGQNIIASGKVIQVADGWFDTVTMRVADGDNIWYVTYAYQEGESRILENDSIMVYGECDGVETYTSVLGSSVTIPSIKAKTIEMQ